MSVWRPFIQELKRRKVFRVAVVYAATAFVVLQAADLILPALLLPDWTYRMLVLLVLFGFPVALALAWAFDITPEGVKRTEPQRAPAAPAGTADPLPALLGRRAAVVSGALVMLGIGLGAGWFLKPAGAADLIAPAAPAITDKSIAVLPFADFTPGGDQEWFSDGLTEEILNALARLPDLRVASRTGSFRFRGSNEEVAAIAASLGVAHILEGSVRRAGDRVRITAQLIRAADDVHLWSQNFDRDAADVIRVQEEIAFEIARTMRTALDPDALRRMVAAGTNSVAAYEAYLRGQHLSRQDMGRNSLAGLAAFEEARALDPQFADAHLAAASFWMAQMTPTATGSGVTDAPYREQERRAEERLAAAAATATDDVRRLRSEQARAEFKIQLRDAFTIARQVTERVPGEGRAWVNLAAIAIQVGEYDVAASSFRQAAALAENEAHALVDIFNRSHRVDVDGALALARRALALDSLDGAVLYQSHRVFLSAGRVPEAAALAERFRAAGGDGEWLAIVQIRQACAEGRLADATAAYGRLPDGWSRWLALMYLGRHAEAAALLRPMEEAGQLYALSGYLHYTFFDPSPFPNLSAALRRQGIARETLPIPYACPTGSVAASRPPDTATQQEPR
jgi:TolB-like protein